MPTITDQALIHFPDLQIDWEEAHRIYGQEVKAEYLPAVYYDVLQTDSGSWISQDFKSEHTIEEPTAEKVSTELYNRLAADPLVLDPGSPIIHFS